MQVTSQLTGYLFYSFPVHLVQFCGIIYAIVSWRPHPKLSLTMVIGLAGQILWQLFLLASNIVMAHSSGALLSLLSFTPVMSAVITPVLNAVVIAAAFIGFREGKTRQQGIA